MIAATGGSESPAGIYPVLILVYAAGFLGPRAAAVAIGGLAVAHALPVAYEQGGAAGWPSWRSRCPSTPWSAA